MAPNVFNPASVSALLSAVVSLMAGVGARVLGGAPDWEDVRPLAWLGITAAIAAASGFTATLDVPLAAHVWPARVQVLAIALHLAAWLAYLQHGQGRWPHGNGWLPLVPIVAAGIVALFPGAVFQDAVRLRPVPWLGIVYRDPVVSRAGYAVFGVLAACGVAGVVWLAVPRQGRPPLTGLHLAVAAALGAAALHDAAARRGLAAPTPYLLDVALCLPAVVIAALTFRRVAATAAELRQLEGGGVAIPLSQLGPPPGADAAERASAERSAAIGRCCAGVAKELGDPAALIDASLAALAGDLQDDPRDAVWVNLGNARAAARRLKALAQQLRDAGRDASAPPQPYIEVRVGPAVEAAVAAARASADGRVRIETAVAPGLTVLGRDDELVKALSCLVVNGIEAFPAGGAGTVRIRAEGQGERVRIAVEDDGPGMTEGELLHVLEPYRRGGGGAGLAVAAARGLIEGMGGTLRFESVSGRGTTAIVGLGSGATDASLADLPEFPLARPRDRRRARPGPSAEPAAPPRTPRPSTT